MNVRGTTRTQISETDYLYPWAMYGTCQLLRRSGPTAFHSFEVAEDAFSALLSWSARHTSASACLAQQSVQSRPSQLLRPCLPHSRACMPWTAQRIARSNSKHSARRPKRESWQCLRPQRMRWLALQAANRCPAECRAHVRSGSPVPVGRAPVPWQIPRRPCRPLQLHQSISRRLCRRPLLVSSGAASRATPGPRTSCTSVTVISCQRTCQGWRSWCVIGCWSARNAFRNLGLLRALTSPLQMLAQGLMTCTYCSPKAPWRHDGLAHELYERRLEQAHHAF